MDSTIGRPPSRRGLFLIATAPPMRAATVALLCERSKILHAKEGASGQRVPGEATGKRATRRRAATRSVSHLHLQYAFLPRLRPPRTLSTANSRSTFCEADYDGCRRR